LAPSLDHRHKECSHILQSKQERKNDQINVNNQNKLKIIKLNKQ
jgi:hypothetical protein